MFMIVCEMTKDQTKAESFGPIWSLTIEPLWYKLTLDTQVPVFTSISPFYFLSHLTVPMVSVDVNAVVSCRRRGEKAGMRIKT